ADLMGLAGVVEDPLRRRRLSGVDVRHDSEVSVVFDLVGAGHWIGSAGQGVKGLNERRGRFSSNRPRREGIAEGGALDGRLPAVMREGAVRLGHLVRVFTLFDGSAAVVR